MRNFHICQAVSPSKVEHPEPGQGGSVELGGEFSQ